MNAALISLGSKSSEWTAEAMRKYFDEVDMIDLREVDVKLGAEAGVYHNDKPLPHYDCVYAKGSFRYANLLSGISALLHGKSYMPIESRAFNIVHHKLLTHLELQKKGIPMPRTYITPTLDVAKILLKNITYPVVMKFPEGTQGKGVMFADSYASASSMLDALGALKQPFIVQEYIETGDTDIRALVVGDQVVSAMIRVASGDEKRANIHAGGEGKAYDLDRQERKVALDTARALGTNICGVDMLRGPKGPLVLEANISPGLQGITAVTKVDAADRIARFLHIKTEEFVGVEKKGKADDMLKQELADSGKELITNLHFKGDKIVLPDMVTKVTKFTEEKDYIIRAEKGKLSIEEFVVKRG